MKNLDEIQAEGVKQYKAKNFAAALKIVDEVHRLDPNFKEAYYLEAAVWKDLHNFVKEYDALKKLLPLLKFSSPKEKDYAAEVFCRAGDALAGLSLHAEAKKFYDLALKTNDPPKFGNLSNVLYYGNTREDFSVEAFRALCAEFKKIFADIKPFPRKFYAHEKIRVGFLSGDFRNHPVINWAWSLLSKLDKNFFTTYFYSNNKTDDVVTGHLRKTADAWRDVQKFSDKQLAALIREDEIDILFDLSGQTYGNRLHAAAYHPASVQVSGVGYIGSTSLDCFDYFLSDIYCAGNENFFTEKVLKLPHSHICYEPPTKLAPADFPPCVKNNFVTFGSFNQFRKITEPMLRAWKKILDAVPESHLLLKHKIFDTSDGRNFVGERLKSFGFDLARVEMRGFSKDYLAEYNDMDVALDTFPYTGGVTTCEALFMGVPVVSLYGERHGTRFGLSILKNVGLEELAVNSYDEYVARAVMLAGDRELLTILRKNLRTMMKKSPLMNSELYLREIQAAFKKILDVQKNFWGSANVGGCS